MPPQQPQQAKEVKQQQVGACTASSNGTIHSPPLPAISCLPLPRLPPSATVPAAHAADPDALFQRKDGGGGLLLAPSPPPMTRMSASQIAVGDASQDRLQDQEYAGLGGGDALVGQEAKAHWPSPLPSPPAARPAPAPSSPFHDEDWGCAAGAQWKGGEDDANSSVRTAVTDSSAQAASTAHPPPAPATCSAVKGAAVGPAGGAAPRSAMRALEEVGEWLAPLLVEGGGLAWMLSQQTT